MKHRIVDNFIHQLRAARASTPQHDELAYLYDEAMEKLSQLADGLYKKARGQSDEINATL
jgi:hypothetical protein